jgi:mono/diheme cytochrome c family protein
MGISAAAAQDSDMLALGEALVAENCGACHAIGTDDASPLEGVRALRDLSQDYPVAFLAESLAEGILTGHPAMPVLEFDAGEVDAVIAWLESIQVQ